MFDNDYFERWLDSEASKAMEKITNHESIDQQEMMVLVLKAQTNHITQMEQDLRGEMIALREDMDKRFEQVDKRFDTMIARMDKFMIWSFSNTFIAAGIVVALVKYL
ncbi:MAG: hypothetical protein HFP81_06750 [Methylococcales symbiont of Hymedesmia sp. n. MRB-2018]|nr:MAG: hypothetical protein HFP81_06750 [Methylococcales symbiont of Hymedesmia sp. n. MRB-2018]ORU94543.1 MAG: hypothetical protein A6F72_08880 [Cycloclasticus sp. symbiont of Poecilosclerida sp. N]